MKTVKVYRNKSGKICGYASNAEDGEEMLFEAEEFRNWFNSNRVDDSSGFLRMQRNDLLKESDWAVLPDANPKPSKEAWLTYRQALRDLPQHFEDPSEVVWPQKPE